MKRRGLRDLVRRDRLASNGWAALLLCVNLVSGEDARAQTIVRDSSLTGTRAGNTLVWLDVGAARTQQFNRIASNGASLGAGFRRGGQRTSFMVDAAMFAGNDSVSAGQLTGSFSLQLRPSFLTEIAGGVTSFRPFDSTKEGNRHIELRQHFTRRIGSTTASARINGALGIVNRRPESCTFVDIGTTDCNFNSSAFGAGGGIARGGFTVSSGWQRLRTNDWPLVEASGDSLILSASAYDFDHVDLRAQYARARWFVQAGIEFLNGRRTTSDVLRASSVAAAYEVAPGLTVIASGGRQLVDPLRGYPRARYTSLGVRYTRALGGTVSASAPLLDREATLELPPVSGGILIVRITANADDVVELMGSHTDWAPVRLDERIGGSVVARVTLPSGTHRIAVRINGGKWRAPRGLARVVDDLGGEVGLVVVP